MIAVSGVRRYYGSHAALDNVSFSLPGAGIACVLGPNGAGKSTLLKILAGYCYPQQGSVNVCGFSAVEQPLEVRRCTGYMPERTALYDDMTPAQFLLFCAAARNIPAADRLDAVNQAMAAAGVTDVRDRRNGGLSYGFRRRVALAQAMLAAPRVLILDEPANGLDPRQIVDFRNIVRNFARDRLVVISTHIMQEAEELADYLLVIYNGTCAAAGTLPEILESAQAVSLEDAFMSVTGGLHG